MGVFDFLKGNKKGKSERTEKPSPEQKLFFEKAMEIVIPTFEQFGFQKHRIEIGKHSSTIIYRKDKQYLKISSSTYPRDYPYHYNIILGEGNSEDFFEYDWNSIALWRFKKEINPELKVTEYEFPKDNGIEPSLKNANSELIKYGLTFLNGELELFHKIRKEQNKDREPYKIHSPDKNGNYQTSFEPKSVEQKKKYS
ncbi:hypothetical protein H3Z83_11850 [Tenacibaculum sp. S7007]|uniref:DUF4304 domain-containing protein n=1 Tax=Tenacibaculum pelagium TaxID=2759527 RepID=A0A839ARD4_9FLAO|nr:hypothetical protein [Tenacibaculum pelagium]MBA6157207.1 hypothetical protein [Tenacibaculum pelagium]